MTPNFEEESHAEIICFAAETGCKI